MSSKLFFIFFIIFICCDNIICQDEQIDYDCKINDDCISFKTSDINATCVNNKCVCFENLRKIPQECKPTKNKLSNLVGAPCPCTILKSHCAENKCLCDQNYIASEDKRKCIKEIVQLGDACDFDIQCVKYDRFASCEKHTCVCLKNFTEINQVCRSKIAPGNHCENDAECQLNTEKTVCLDHQCVCENNYVINIDNTLCLPSAGHNEKCLDSRQCLHKLGPGSICDNRVCVCDANHYVIDGDKVRCEKKTFAGDSCNNHNDCYQYHIEEGYNQAMECLVNICQCKDGYKQFIDKSCVKNSAGSTHTLINLLILSLFLFSVFFHQK